MSPEAIVSVRAVAERLGGMRVLGRELRSDSDLIDAVRAGLPVAALEALLDELGSAAGQQAVIYRAVGSARTLQRKRAARGRLSIDESDRLARLARIVVRAEEALGDRENAHRWLAKPNRALGGVPPFELLDSDAGSLTVERILGRIEHGVHT